jgi:ubiquitin C-terminal hydrolase
VNREKEPGISLKMPEDPVEPTLKHYLDRHFEDATAEGLKCGSIACKDRARDRKMSTIIVGGPEILVIQVARMRVKQGMYGLRMVKVNDEVQYGDRLDLSDYSDGRLSYQLNGVVAHSGKRLTEGHYVSMVRSQKGDGSVFCNDNTIDDSQTKEQVLSLAEGKEFQSYLLIYQKIGGGMANCV